MMHGFYTPKAEEDPEDGKTKLKGVDPVSGAYSRELLRAWEIWEMGKRLQVEGLCGHVLERVSGLAWVGYERGSLLEVAREVFIRGDLREKQGNGESQEGEADGEDTEGEAFEEWVVEQVAERFRDIMLKNAKLFLDVAEVASRRSFLQRELRSKAELVDAVGGEVVVIPDD